MSYRRLSVSQRLQHLLVQGLVLFAVSTGVLTVSAVTRFRDEALAAHLAMADTLSRAVDLVLADAAREVAASAEALAGRPGGDLAVLHALRFRTFPGASVELRDGAGLLVAADPPGGPPQRLRTATQGILVEAGSGGPQLRIVQPVSRGDRAGSLAVVLPTGAPALAARLAALAPESHLGLLLVDPGGTVLASARPGLRWGTPVPALAAALADGRHAAIDGATVDESEPQVSATAPLRAARLAVVVYEPRRAIFAPLATLGWALAASVALLVLGTAVVARGLGRSLVEPISRLAVAAARLRRGELSEPIAVAGDREVEALAQTLEDARQRLRRTLGELEALNNTLERQVAARTQRLVLQLANLRLVHDVALATLRDADPARSMPPVLALLSSHFTCHAAAVRVTPPGGSRVAWAHPPGAGSTATLAWLERGEPAPPGWRKHALVYQGETWGELFTRWSGPIDDRLMEAVTAQLALSLHHGYLVARTLAADTQRKALVRRLLDAGEEERRRIARELHDEISQLLTVVDLSLERMAPTPGADPERERCRGLLANAQKELHRIIYDLRPSLLDDLGLAPAVEWYAAHLLGPAGITASLEIEPLPELPDEVEIVAFRIYQEIVTNVLRHSGAENVAVELGVRDGTLELAVEDDGRGIAPGRGPGAGIVGMRERADLVGGRLEIDSEPGAGTRVALQVPLEPVPAAGTAAARDAAPDAAAQEVPS